MTNLILCGGAGKRLWPLSRNELPKQFFPLFSGKSLFVETVQRNKPLVDDFWLASNALHMTLASEQLAQCGITRFSSLVEPIGRNTAPAIALACLAMDPKELVLVTPSDHHILHPEGYQEAVRSAMALAQSGSIVTFGIKPTFPETGFGYIEASGHNVLAFKEKPNFEVAQTYVNSERHYWNSGMFVFQAGVFLRELERCADDVFRAAVHAFTPAQGRQQRPSLEAMKLFPSISVDIAVMEKTSIAKVVPIEVGWSDLGSFDALFQQLSPDEAGNAVLGVSPIALGSKNNMVVGNHRKIVLIDVTDLMVIDTADALLVVRRGSSQKVKDVVDQIDTKTGWGPSLL